MGFAGPMRRVCFGEAVGGGPDAEIRINGNERGRGRDESVWIIAALPGRRRGSVRDERKRYRQQENG